MSVVRILNKPAPRLRPIDFDLHVVAVVSNPCLYKRRYRLAREFFERMQQTPNVILYIVELAYGDQPFVVTIKGHPHHLQLRTKTPLWHKENMINLGVQKLLPKTWKAFAWIDADVQFTNRRWAFETLCELSRCDVVQPFHGFSHLDQNDKPMGNTSYSSCYAAVNQVNDVYAHCGFAWAMTRTAYERIGGLLECSILGSGDAFMSKAFTKHGELGKLPVLSEGYQKSYRDFEAKCAGFRVGYVHGGVYHYFHGTLKNRNYNERWEILIRHQFDPLIHLKKDSQGVLIPSPACPAGLAGEILKYFQERNEDESITGIPAEAPQSSAAEDTSASPSQCTDLQSPVVESVLQCETTHDSESCVVPTIFLTSADTPN